MHPRLRPSRTAALVLAALLATAGCSSGGSDAADAPAGPPAAEVGATLVGTVGTEDDPESFTIELATEDGEPVRSLAAGDYTIEVTDYSRTHNFALRGPGVDEATSVPEVGESTFEVTLEAGEYTFICDPHPSMVGTVQVT